MDGIGPLALHALSMKRLLRPLSIILIIADTTVQSKLTTLHLVRLRFIWNGSQGVFFNVEVVLCGQLTVQVL